MSLSSSGYLPASGQGDGYRFFNALATLKAGEPRLTTPSR